MACIAFWELNVHPITFYKYHNIANRSAAPVKYLKTVDFEQDLYVLTTDLMTKYNLGSAELGKKIRNCGYEKITCLQKKWVLKEFENHLK